MDTGVNLSLDLDVIAQPFLRLDEGDTSGLLDLDLLVDLPEILTVARMHFTVGVGYEVIFTELADADDHRDAVQLTAHCLLLRREPWGFTPSGYHAYRCLYWECQRPWLS